MKSAENQNSGALFEGIPLSEIKIELSCPKPRNNDIVSPIIELSHSNRGKILFFAETLVKIELFREKGQNNDII